mmetsp:Transcript_119423/g.186478  ORF Transcript_119423/g.186478 Transcript_119423/m.186478 type:complete len:105 (+) Transcript_119423:81-395(+)
MLQSLLRRCFPARASKSQQHSTHTSERKYKSWRLQMSSYAMVRSANFKGRSVPTSYGELEHMKLLFQKISALQPRLCCCWLRRGLFFVSDAIIDVGCIAFSFRH